MNCALRNVPRLPGPRTGPSPSSPPTRTCQLRPSTRSSMHKSAMAGNCPDRQTAISKMTANNLCTDNGTRAPSCGYFSPFWERIFHFHASEAHDIYFQTVENGQRRRSGAPTGNRTRTRTPPQVPIDSPSHPSWQKNVTAVVSRRRLLIKWPKI